MNLGGKYFTPHIKSGDPVKKGDLMLEFDSDAIKAEGYDITTPVIISNSYIYQSVGTEVDGAVKTGTALLTLVEA